MTLPEFRSALFKWVADEYHHMPHRGLNGESPYNVWQEQAKIFHPFVPADMEEMKLIKGEVKFCTISGSEGIQHNGRRYNDTPKRLKSIGDRLRAQGKEPVVRVEFTHSNIQSVNVVNPFTDEIFEVCVNDPKIPVGMTEAEFKVTHKPYYGDKGCTGRRATKSSKTVKDANQAHDVRMKDVGPRSANRIEPDKLFDEVQRLKKEGLQGPKDSKTQLGSVNTRTYKPTDTSYDNDEVYEDD
jgi:putative transposase